MLPDRDRQLLAAYVDGELSRRQRRYVVRLLRRSLEARRLLRQLKADAHALRQLPRPSLPVDLTEPVLRLIAERNLTPGQRHTVPAVPKTAWLGPLASWAAAAAVLLLLGLASFLFFAASLEQPVATEVAQKRSEPPAVPLLKEELKTPTFQKDENQTASHEPSAPATEKDHPSTVKQPKPAQPRRSKPKPDPADKPPPPKEETALTERLEMFQFDRVPDLLPIVIKVSDLDHAPVRTKFLEELHKDNAFRLELPCPNGTKALERVQNAARTLHIGLLIEKQAQERIKRKWRSNYVLYIENIMPEELIQLVKQIGVEDRKSTVGKKNAETQIDYLVLTRMTAGHRKELTTLLGVDPTATVSGTTRTLNSDSRDSLTEITARQVKQALAGQGSTLRPGSGKTETKPPEQIALVLSYNPTRSSPNSEEIKQFLEGRKPARAGALHVLVVLRGT